MLRLLQTFIKLIDRTQTEESVRTRFVLSSISLLYQLHLRLKSGFPVRNEGGQ